MSNNAPYEIVAAPFTVWIADASSASFPALNAEPGQGWFKLGTSGDRNYTEDGVTVSHAQEISKWRSLGSTGARKAFRSTEDLTISFTVADLTLEQYAAILSGGQVDATEPGQRSMGLSRGLTVKEYALLVRGHVSPYSDTGVLQYEVPRAVESGTPEPVFRKDEPAALAVQFDALEDDEAEDETERFGRLVTTDGES